MIKCWLLMIALMIALIVALIWFAHFGTYMALAALLIAVIFLMGVT